MPKWLARLPEGDQASGWNFGKPARRLAVGSRAGTRDLKSAYYVYVLLSQKDNKLYAGQTNNLDKRIKEHNNGKVCSTKHRRPLALVYKEFISTRAEAVKREKHYKTQRGRQNLKLILKNL